MIQKPIPQTVSVESLSARAKVYKYSPIAIPVWDATLYIERDSNLLSDGNELSDYTFRFKFNSSPNIVEFDFLVNSNMPTAYLVHRLASKNIRGTGISSEFFRMCVDFLNREAGTKNVQLEAGQISVYKWAKKNGFRPKSESEIERVQRIEEYIQGDRSFLLEDATPRANEPYLFDVSLPHTSRSVFIDAYRVKLDLDLDTDIPGMRTHTLQRVTSV